MCCLLPQESVTSIFSVSIQICSWEWANVHFKYNMLHGYGIEPMQNSSAVLRAVGRGTQRRALSAAVTWNVMLVRVSSRALLTPRETPETQQIQQQKGRAMRWARCSNLNLRFTHLNLIRMRLLPSLAV